MTDLPGRGEVNPYGIPVPNPHEQDGPDDEDAGPDFDRDLEADLEDARMRDYDDATSLLEDNR